MKKLFLAFMLLTTLAHASIEIPKKILGEYQAVVPAFEFEDENHEKVQASSYVINIHLKSNHLLYKMGDLEMKGLYSELNEDGKFIDLAVNITNNVSIDFDLDLNINKKTGEIRMYGLKGVPEAKLEKKEIKKEKKRRFRRL